MSVTNPPMDNRKIMAEEAVKKRLDNPEAVLGRLKKRLAEKKYWHAKFMDMTEDQKRKVIRNHGGNDEDWTIQRYIKW